jgi:ribA/ribD-fused uncharacterized protein
VAVTHFPSDQPPLSISDLPDPANFSEFTPFIKGVFSQWHHTPFRLEKRDFVTAEQWMMYAKATLFGDADAAAMIADNNDPAIQKRLGQAVQGFDQATWDRWKIDIVYRGNIAKFSQNEGALRQLRNTAGALLVEANPRDWIWGNGCAIDNASGHAPANWRGQNLLGLILTKVRIDLVKTI